MYQDHHSARLKRTLSKKTRQKYGHDEKIYVKKTRQEVAETSENDENMDLPPPPPPEDEIDFQ
jgi:hypothetical protein